jgi:2-polyprenyl-6-methoxyphenol hydroxylase-like FAD-dependent oxidoreductase
MNSTSSQSGHKAFDVIVVGAGPVGLTLAIDLGRRGVRTLLLERNPTTGPWPKMDRTNARSMELFRRLGIVERVRALGYPPDNPMDVFLLTRMTEPPLAVLKFGSVAEKRAEVAACSDGSLPLEPYQLVSQNKVEPLLKEIAEAIPEVTVRYGEGLDNFEQDDGGVSVQVRLHEGGTKHYRASFLVGCDGGVSTVRKRLGVKLEGQGRIREMRQVIFGSDDLYERIPVGKGRHYNFVNGSVIVAQGDRKEFTLHTALPEDSDFIALLRDIIGFDCRLEIRKVISWRLNLLLAEHYQIGRVFMAGDAIHLVVPTGGLGMNTGLGDAIDLSWKLAGAVHGWAGAGLLPSYEQERRPVGTRNIEASGWAAEGVGIWSALVTPRIHENSAEGSALRKQVGESFTVNQGRMHGMRGAEFGYSYAGSPLVASEPDNLPQWDINTYTPSARPGVRVPHMWLKDGRALHDLLGADYTLLDLRGNFYSVGLRAAFRAIGAPLAVLQLDEPHLRRVFGRSVLLLRPDLHIAWSGEGPLLDATALAKQVTGHGTVSLTRHQKDAEKAW